MDNYKQAIRATKRSRFSVSVRLRVQGKSQRFKSQDLCIKHSEVLLPNDTTHKEKINFREEIKKIRPRYRSTPEKTKLLAPIHLQGQKIKKKEATYPIKPYDLKISFSSQLRFQVKDLLPGQQIWYLGQNQVKEAFLKTSNKLGFIRLVKGQQVHFRYQIIQFYGNGTFGQIFKAFDHKERVLIALKVINNLKKYRSQALIQQRILKNLASSDPKDQQSFIKMKHSFNFRTHVCLVFELLSLNLYQLQQCYSFNFPINIIHKFSIQLLNVLAYLKRKRVIHCDIKPQNVLLKRLGYSSVKLIDFGSSCYSNQVIYNYIQSRYYRAPQVLLGLPYSFQIDMWSFSVLIAELYLGSPLFPGISQLHQILLLVQAIGYPPSDFTRNSEKWAYYSQSEQFKYIYPQNTLNQRLKGCDSDFKDFLEKILKWRPVDRMSAIQGLKHRWILKYLPKQLVDQHLQYVDQLCSQTLQTKQIADKFTN